MKRFVADGDLVEHFRSIRGERRRLRQQRRALCFHADEGIVAADIGEQIRIPRCLLAQVSRQRDGFEKGLPDLGRVGALIERDQCEQSPRTILGRSHLDRALQHPSGLRVFSGFGQHHAQVPDPKRRWLEINRLLEGGGRFLEPVQPPVRQGEIVVGARIVRRQICRVAVLLAGLGPLAAHEIVLAELLDQAPVIRGKADGFLEVGFHQLRATLIPVQVRQRPVGLRVELVEPQRLLQFVGREVVLRRARVEGAERHVSRGEIGRQREGA